MSKINLNTVETFNEIEDVKLRNYNRAMMSLNLLDSNGEADVRSYFQRFNDHERLSLAAMLIAIKQDPEKVKQEVIKHVTPIE